MPASFPAWVPAVLLGLLFLGYRQSRTRVVRPGTLVALALAMCGLSLYGVVAAFGAVTPALLAWAAAYAAVAFGGRRLVSPRGMAMAGAAVRLQGSWVPAALLLGIFAAKFTLGFAAGAHAGFLRDTGFVALMSAVLGALSGGFGARALAVDAFARAAQPRGQGAPAV